MSRGIVDHAERINEVRSLLEQANDRLLDISMSVLSEALERGESARPEQEKRIAQARRAIDRASEALRGLSSD